MEAEGFRDADQSPFYEHGERGRHSAYQLFRAGILSLTFDIRLDIDIYNNFRLLLSIG
jgi:hypothetical protein